MGESAVPRKARFNDAVRMRLDNDLIEFGIYRRGIRRRKPRFVTEVGAAIDVAMIKRDPLLPAGFASRTRRPSLASLTMKVALVRGYSSGSARGIDPQGFERRASRDIGASRLCEKQTATLPG